MFKIFRRKKTPFLPLEEALLRAVADQLPPEARAKMEAQICATRYVHRYLAWNDVELFARKRNEPHRKWPADCLFENRSDDLKFARVRFEVKKQKYTTHLHSVAGQVFSIATRPSPKKISKLIPEIVDVKILADPEQPEVVNTLGSKAHPSYLRYIAAFGAGDNGAWQVHAPENAYRVDLPEGCFWVVAESDGHRFVLIPDDDREGSLLVCETGESPVPVGTFIEAVDESSE